MLGEEVGEVGGSEVVEGLVGGEYNFEVYPVFYQEPVKVMEDWGDVIS